MGRRWLAREAQQAENLRKMFLAMVDDIGVVLIKLADRLHNMRTLDALPTEKQTRIAQQTLEIYAPLANRLGIWQFKSELEDLAFRVINPEAYHALTREFEKRARDSAPVHRGGQGRSSGRAAGGGIERRLPVAPSTSTRSTARCCLRAGRSMRSTTSMGRILVNDRQDCYGALGVVHARWHPLPGEFDDYIATPKDSMYQSLHTAVVGPGGHAVEIQIRSWRCTARRNMASRPIGATKKAAAPTLASKRKWPGSGSSWSGVTRSPMPKSSSSR